MSVLYLNDIKGDSYTIKRTETTPRHNSRTGYGRKIPTQYIVIDNYSKRARRVYAICYSNAASLYVLISGIMYFLHDYNIPEKPEIYRARRPADRLTACADCFQVIAGNLDVMDLDADREGEILTAINAIQNDGRRLYCDDDGSGAGFSWTPCDVCKSKLGGDRYAVTFTLKGGSI